MYTLLKSEVGSYPEPVFPRGVNLSAEDRKARRRLYPITVVYASYLTTLLVQAARASHALRAFVFLGLGAAIWGPMEYAYHRYLLHGVFPKGKGLLRRALHYLFDATHADHHARPWDGYYINGHLDSLLVAALVFPLSFLAPAYTASVFVATVLFCYMLEEWVHHATHFWNFDWSYFQYLRRRHLWHHSRHGAGRAYGITSDLWDAVFGTQVPERERALLAGKRAARPEAAPSREALSA